MKKPTKTKKPKNPFPDIPDPLGYGQRAVDYLRTLKHPKSPLKDKAFQLDPWQEEIVRKIYGPRDADGRRIVRNVIMLLPRGNRKTSLGAALTLLHTDGPEAVSGGEVILAAGDQKQAKIAFREIEGIIRAGDKGLWKKGYAGKQAGQDTHLIRLKEYRNQIQFPNESFVEAISSDAGTQHGRTPTFALVDEIHAWKKADLWEVIRTGLVKVPGSLCVVITTAGRGQENVAYKVINYARKVARGEIDDPHTLPILFETSPDADWQDENVWHAANPGLKHGYPDLPGLRQLAREAAQRPADREAFRQLHLNVWLGHSSDPFVEMSIWDEGNSPVDLSKLRNEPCWLAVDLSSTSDLTVIVAVWRDGEGYIAHPWFFCPRDNIQRKADIDGVPYPLWADEGFIEPTAGNTIDFNHVEDTIRRICRDFDVHEIAFDPHMAHNMMQSLLDDGLPCVAFRQGWVSMAPAVKELERAILARQLQHGGHPVLRHHIDCVAVHADSAGNRLFHKGRSRDRIDGAVALAMAVARASAGSDSRSVYDDVSARPEGLLVF
ncbi:terminase large subunit [Hyphomicrobium sp. MC1]|uniref:terminase large subunit n=1 Tax=Hyphomicrobium sp. (strain MC1) TaxID=717785 RepID=UPI000213EB2C|nr:terminase TerL endonuclease subunit [Hyphomicrobium sp. MC1]CCB65399.1 Phage terminase-like protein [Hyphomicrobium sp. MC1]